MREYREPRINVAGYVIKRRASSDVGCKGDFRVAIFLGVVELPLLAAGVDGIDRSWYLGGRRGVTEAIYPSITWTKDISQKEQIV